LVFFGYFGSSSPPEMVIPAGHARERFYNIGVWPSAFFDGTPGPAVSEPDSFYSVYRDMVDAARSVQTSLEMSLDTLLTRVDSNTVSIGVHITPTDSSVNQAGILRLMAVVYEDSVPYEFLGETLYARTVARAMVGDSLGLPLALRFGDEFDTMLTLPLGNWRKDFLGCAVFVQDTLDKSVLQSVGKQRIPVIAGGKQ